MKISPNTNFNPAIEQMLDARNATQKGGVEKGSSTDFSKTLMDVLKQVNESQQNAAQTQQAFMTGQPVDYHDLMIAMEKASVGMQLTMAVRNKILEAYQEINRMQV